MRQNQPKHYRMKKIFTLSMMALCAMGLWADEVTDVISGETVEFTTKYEEQTWVGPSGATYLITAKYDEEDDGTISDVPQFKASKGGIVTTVSPGLVKNVTVEYKKSNESLIVRGSNEPFTTSTGNITEGTELGIIEYEKNATVSFDVEGEWQYVGLAATNENDKAFKFISISITWEKNADGISAVEAAANEVPVYYNLLGVRVDNPSNGIYIRCANGKSQKVILK